MRSDVMAVLVGDDRLGGQIGRRIVAGGDQQILLRAVTRDCVRPAKAIDLDLRRKEDGDR